MVGYSGTPLAGKLGIKEGALIVLLGAPDGFEAELEPLPDGVRVRRRLQAGIDVAVLFVTSRRQLERRFPQVVAALRPAGGLWVAWPRWSSGVATDLTENTLRDVVLPTGLVDNKVCAVNQAWSGLRFVVRRENRPPRS